ncbi:hypothetical protein EVAR_43994_1 [Eumeta japonica]|uniref:Uncharacterized protein n=1 Tax=Eumeta variegata TaxID=151549 RepID=A0A4C1XEB3_EUMVA|nr:hypothetical protein EVAR_43994_1 [Eumeta japonica]
MRATGKQKNTAAHEYSQPRGVIVVAGLLGRNRISAGGKEWSEAFTHWMKAIAKASIFCESVAPHRSSRSTFALQPEAWLYHVYKFL